MSRESNLPNSQMNLGVGVVLLLLVGILSGCSSTGEKDWASSDLPDPSSIPDAVPKVEPRSKYGNPESYVVFGRRYYTKSSSKGHVERGMASWYGRDFHGRKTSSGERYDMYAMTAAHKTLPLPTYARVTNMKNGRSAVVKINDRGPFHGNRVIDLSYSAARKLGVVAKGTAMVEIKAIDPRHPESDRRDNFFAFADTTSEAETPVRKRVAAARTTPAATRAAAAAKATRTRVAKAEEPRATAKKVPIQVAKAEKPQATAKSAPVQAAQVAKPQVTAEKAAVQVVKAERSQAATGEVPVRVAEMAKASAPKSKVALVGAGKTSRMSGRSSMYLQVGAFGSRANAEHLRRRLAQQIAEQVQIRSIDDETAHWYKVHVGPLDSRKSAKDLSQRLASLGLAGSHIVTE